MFVKSNFIEVENGRKEKSTEYKTYFQNCTDYYQFYGNCATEIRPIIVTEFYDFENMSTLKKSAIYFWYGLCCFFITFNGIRLDRLSDSKYMKTHYIHYICLNFIPVCLLFLLALHGLNIVKIQPLLVGYTPPPIIGITILFCSEFFYVTAVMVWMSYIKEWVKTNFGAPIMIKVWEYYIMFLWNQEVFFVLVFNLLPVENHAITSAILPEFAQHFNMNWLKIVLVLVGYILLFISIFARSAAVWMTGFPTYFWYDMVLHKKNAYFIEGGIYTYFKSPTYTLGRLGAIGAGLIMGSLDIIFLGIFSFAMIMIWDYTYEQPFVKKMYLSDTDNEQEFETSKIQ